MTGPTHLRIEHLDEPLGITTAHPRMSWRLPAGTNRQLAYRIRTDEWDTGCVESDQQLLVPYAGPALRPGQRTRWTVKAWTDAGESDWAEPAWWETGLLDARDWTARWVEPPRAGAALSGRPWLFRGSFTVAAPAERVRLYATAHGIYECFLNGHRVGDRELTPGYTSYRSHLHVDTYDVTDLIVPGTNVLGAVVSDGWYRGLDVPGSLYATYGNSIGLLLQVNLYRGDGPPTTFGTGPDWRAATGPIRSANLIEGVTVDLRVDGDGWHRPEASLAGWSEVSTADVNLGRLRASPAPPVRRIEHVRPVAVTRLGNGRQVVDLGQNINGWVRLANLGPAGTTVRLTHGEALDAEGDVTVANIAIDANSRFQRDEVTSAGAPGQVFEPRHTTHGFRYVRIEGHPGEIGPDDVSGVVVHTDLRRTGWFSCSDERLNRLHEAIVWSFRGNACDVPTDCPTRERMGWTGDWQIFLPAAAFLYDVAGFTSKWLADLAAEQRPDGVVTHCVPEPTPFAVHAALDMPPGSAGYADAAVIVPWETYQAYGDRDVLQRQWASMVAWVEYAARQAREHRHASRIAARPVPAEHERFVWDTGFHWGEWLEPGAFIDGSQPAEISTAALGAADHGDIATAYLCHSAGLLARAAEVLGRDADARRYADLAGNVRRAWQLEFVRPDGRLIRDTQAGYVRALAFDLAPPPLRADFAQRLVQLIEAADDHLGTGFLATPYLLPVLADNGHLDVAYRLLRQDTEPSWLAMIERGATTMWEYWGALDQDGRLNAPHGVGSLNHYSKGAVAMFLHRYVAGLRRDPGVPAYRRFVVQPRPGGGLVDARAALDSPYGRIEVAWQAGDGRLTLDVRVPPSTSAEIRLPDGQRVEAAPGEYTWNLKGSTEIY